MTKGRERFKATYFKGTQKKIQKGDIDVKESEPSCFTLALVDFLIFIWLSGIHFRELNLQ